MRKNPWLVTTAVASLLLAGWAAFRDRGTDATSGGGSEIVSRSPSDDSSPAMGDRSDDDDHHGDNHDDDRSYVFRIPTGEPTALTCEEAKTIIHQVRAGLAYTPEPIPVGAFAAAAADWLDPHGMLSLAKDAPTSQAIAKVGSDLLLDIEGKRQRECASALGPGDVLEKWSDELRAAFDRGRRAGAGEASAAALEPLPPTGDAREIAEEIGRRAGIFEKGLGAQGSTFADVARRRFFPDLEKADWAKVVLASAVRSYVPLVDPHGEWAPFDEESRIYEVDLAPRPPSRLWSRAVPTAVGVRITDGARAPLQVDDVVLSVARVATAGLPLEQVDQLAFTTVEGSDSDRGSVHAVVLRGGSIKSVEIARPSEPPPDGDDESSLPSERVAFGEGDVLVVGIRDVRDNLGDELAALVAGERERTDRKLTGVVLDLRGNGGGSTDGALGALALFLPGAPLFAMKRRDGTIEVDRAPVPREHDRWTGPIATFVDATTASAGEMIAGAIAAYRRGPSVGTTTFGKGCAQEYVDDDAHAGVLKLTTLVYALPDGSPVQRVGLTPQLRFPFTLKDADPTTDREATIARAAPPWRGPDLRDRAAVNADEVAWPPHGGNVGPCSNDETCRALRLLGTPRRPAVAKH